MKFSLQFFILLLQFIVQFYIVVFCTVYSIVLYSSIVLQFIFLVFFFQFIFLQFFYSPLVYFSSFSSQQFFIYFMKNYCVSADDFQPNFNNLTIFVEKYSYLMNVKAIVWDSWQWLKILILGWNMHRIRKASHRNNKSPCKNIQLFFLKKKTSAKMYAPDTFHSYAHRRPDPNFRSIDFAC